MENKFSKLEEAMLNMLNTQTALGSQMIAISERQARTEATFLSQLASQSERHEKRHEELSERYEALSERQMNSEKIIIDILNEHTRILNNLPEAIKEKIGFTR